MADDERDRLRETIAALRYWACNGTTEAPNALRLDESLIHETDEAWISVITPDGPECWCGSTRTEWLCLDFRRWSGQVQPRTQPGAVRITMTVVRTAPGISGRTHE
ncbi:DUF6210 family protein [Streptomyces vietnamensis]|uniref:DUF6210 family protein n=1 Tax=Streptomyces vietnamensis TaxID=362257 RepID=UPI0037A742E6